MKYLGIPVLNIKQLMSKLTVRHLPEDAKMVSYRDDIYADQYNTYNRMVSQYVTPLTFPIELDTMQTGAYFQAWLMNHKSFFNAFKGSLLAELDRYKPTVLDYTPDTAVGALNRLRSLHSHINPVWLRIAPRTYALLDLYDLMFVVSNPTLIEDPEFQIHAKLNYGIYRKGLEAPTVLKVPRPLS